MPTISIFFGIVIKMYYREHNPPHFHAFYQGFEGVFLIDSGELIRGKFPKKAKRIIKDWAKEHRRELEEDWDLLMKKKPLNRIPGADQ